MDQNRINKCREWIARRTAQIDQREKQYADQYPMTHPITNRRRLEEIEIERFWIGIHRWELDQMIETGVDDYPQQTKND